MGSRKGRGSRWGQGRGGAVGGVTDQKRGASEFAGTYLYTYTEQEVQM